jgi:hypothetical protein
MTLTIQLDEAEQARLDAAAKREGMAPAELARKVLAYHLPPVSEPVETEDPTLALFRQWEEEGTARTPEEAARENELWEQFQANVNETRAALGMRKL